MNGWVQYMGLRQFQDEGRRRVALQLIRANAKRNGYLGRITFAHAGIHGRTRGLIVVTIYPVVHAAQTCPQCNDPQCRCWRHYYRHGEYVCSCPSNPTLIEETSHGTHT